MKRKIISGITGMALLLAIIINGGTAKAKEDPLNIPGLGELPPLPPWGVRRALWSLQIEEIARGLSAIRTLEETPLASEGMMEFFAGVDKVLPRIESAPWGRHLGLLHSDFWNAFYLTRNSTRSIFDPDDIKEIRIFEQLLQIIESIGRNYYLEKGKCINTDELYGSISGDSRFQQLLTEGNLEAKIVDDGLGGAIVIGDSKYSLTVTGSKEYLTVNVWKADTGDFSYKTIKYSLPVSGSLIIEENCIYNFREKGYFLIDVFKKVSLGSEGYIYEEKYKYQERWAGKFLIKKLGIEEGRITAQIEYYVYDDQ